MSQEDKHLDEGIKIDEMEEAGDITAEEAANLRHDLDAEMGMGEYAPEADTGAGESEYIPNEELLSIGDDMDESIYVSDDMEGK